MINETWDRHLYTNDNSQKLDEVKREVIQSEALEPDELVDYIIQKYHFTF